MCVSRQPPPQSSTPAHSSMYAGTLEPSSNSGSDSSGISFDVDEECDRSFGQCILCGEGKKVCNCSHNGRLSDEAYEFPDITYKCPSVVTGQYIPSPLSGEDEHKNLLKELQEREEERNVVEGEGVNGLDLREEYLLPAKSTFPFSVISQRTHAGYITPLFTSFPLITNGNNIIVGGGELTIDTDVYTDPHSPRVVPVTMRIVSLATTVWRNNYTERIRVQEGYVTPWIGNHDVRPLRVHVYNRGSDNLSIPVGAHIANLELTANLL